MKRFLPLTLLASLGFVSCQEEAKVTSSSEQGATQEEVAALKAELVQLEGRLVKSQNERFRKEAEQMEVLRDLKAMMLKMKEESEKEVVVVAPVEKVGVPAVNDEELKKIAEARKAVRLKAQGEELESLETAKGDTFHELVINRVTDIGVVFRHRGGVARVPFAELPLAWQERFYYDRELALKAHKGEKIAQARYDEAIAISLAEMKKDQDQETLNQSLERLEVAVAELRRQVGAGAGFVQAPAAAPVQGGIFVNPPLIVHNQIPFQNDFLCPPVVQTPVVRTPTLAVPALRNSHSGRLHRPTLQSPTGLRKTVKGSQTRSTGTTVPASRTGVSAPTLQRPASRSSSPAVQRSRSSVSRPASTIQRRSTPTIQKSVTRSSTPARSVPRSTSTPSIRSTPAPSRSSTPRPTIRRSVK